MARIRTIKPEFFRHRGLFLLERDSGLPIRLAFAGLWTVADKEGRFRWEPEEIKLDCLPYDDVDFSRVLDALATRGFVVKYASGGREYGVIPGFKDHQFINNREQDSKLPAAPEVSDNSQELTREARVDDASATRESTAQGEGKGREGKGREDASRTRYAFVGKVIRLTPDDFDTWRKAYHAIPDLMAELTAIDDKFCRDPPSKWFGTASAWLRTKHERLLGDQRKPAKKTLGPAIGTPEWQKMMRDAGAL